jgi:hypothetical protein
MSLNRRQFIKRTGLAAAGTLVAPYVLPSGRLFATSEPRLVNHVVFVLFAGGLRNQETVHQMYLQGQGLASSGNIMPNMLNGAVPSSNLLYNPWTPVSGPTLQSQGTLFREMRYASGPTGHYNGHTVAMTGKYTVTGLNLNINPEFPTVFEYYRKHSDPMHSAKKAWWISEGLGPYPSLNYSRHPLYGSVYGANYLNPATVFGPTGLNYFGSASSFEPDDVARFEQMENFLNNNFELSASDLPGVVNTRADKEEIKQFITSVANGSNPVEFPIPPGVGMNELTGDLFNIAAAWKVIDTFKPELTVVNTFNSDICHTDFSSYISTLHRADYGVGWLWNKIQNDPVMANDTIMICMPEHGRNFNGNGLFDSNGLEAIDHTNDDNSREIFGLIVGPEGIVNHGSVVGTTANPVGQSVDIVPTIAHILGFHSAVSSMGLDGQILQEAFV